MRLRMLGAAVVAVIAASTLSACRSNVGFAAEIDGHTYSESDINDYVTPQAKAVPGQSGSEATPVKSFVVELLILDQLTHRVVDSLSTRKFTDAQIATVEKSVLSGSSTTAYVAKLGVTGYSDSFNKIVVREQTFEALINEAGQNAQAQGQTLDIASILAKLSFPVRVNPRYGTWDAKNHTLVSTVGSTLPSYLKLKSTLGTTTTPGQ